MMHRYKVEPSMGRGWRAECECEWHSMTYLTLSLAYSAGDFHVTQSTERSIIRHGQQRS